MFIRQLEYLVTLAREKHFAHAAEACHVSQPALSSGIRNLEKELGIVIVQRERRFVGFTVEGERVLEWAQQTLASLAHMREDASTAKTSMTGLLRIGAIPTTMPITACLTAACRSLYPNIRFAIASLSFEAIVSGLDRFEVDLGLTYLDDPVAGGFECLPMFDERYVLLADRRAKLEDSISWEQAAYLPLCLLSARMRNRQIIDAAFRKVGAKPEVILETDSLFSLYAHVTEAGLYSVVPHSLLTFLDTRRVQARPLTPTVKRAIGLIARNRPALAPLSGAVLAVARGLSLQPRFDAGLSSEGILARTPSMTQDLQ